MMGAPDDYISSLLPDVLRKFSAIYPNMANGRRPMFLVHGTSDSFNVDDL
jgi:hypothetical protein